MANIKFTITVKALKTWEKVLGILKSLWSNKLYTFAVAFVLLSVLAVVVMKFGASESGGAYNVLGFNPYELLGVTKESSKKEIKKQFRRLSAKYHHDVISEDERDNARKMFINLQRAQEVLLDETKRENWEMYGDPEPQWWATQFPSWIMNPGKVFLGIYASLGFFFMVVLPITMLLLTPGLSDPPQWIKSSIYGEINLAERALMDEDYEKVSHHLNEANAMWKQARKLFPEYKKTFWYGVIDFHIVARRCQSLMFQNKMNKAVELIEKFASVHNKKTTLESWEAQVYISNQVKDLLESCKDSQSTNRKQKSSALGPFEFNQALKKIAEKI